MLPAVWGDGAAWSALCVFYNPTDTACTVSLPAGQWKLLSDGTSSSLWRGQSRVFTNKAPPCAVQRDCFWCGVRRFECAPRSLCASSAEKLFIICKSGKSADFPDLLFHGRGLERTPSVACGASSPKGTPYGDAAKFPATAKAVPLRKVAANAVSRRKG